MPRGSKSAAAAPASSLSNTAALKYPFTAQCSFPRALLRCERSVSFDAYGPTFFRALRRSPSSFSTGVDASRDFARAIAARPHSSSPPSSSGPHLASGTKPSRPPSLARTDAAARAPGALQPCIPRFARRPVALAGARRGVSALLIRAAKNIRVITRPDVIDPRFRSRRSACDVTEPRASTTARRSGREPWRRSQPPRPPRARCSERAR